MLDNVLGTLDLGLRSLYTRQPPNRPNPADRILDDPLTTQEKQLSGRLMRVNHSGEIAAQGLYQGQALTARDRSVRKQLDHAAEEEIDHLRWCQSRCGECDVAVSRLGPLWYLGSVAIGAAAGAFGDKWSLGFLAETEHQVVAHLDGHLRQLPVQDEKSRLIVEQMRDEEGDHAATAEQAGGVPLPLPVRLGMRLFAKIMTRTSYWI